MKCQWNRSTRELCQNFVRAPDLVPNLSGRLLKFVRTYNYTHGAPKT